MKVWEYLDFFARCYGIGPAARRRMIGDLLELVDLADKRDAYVQTLSRGMQQRLCLAHALVHDPQVLLLDEPASGLDPRARVELRELLRELRVAGQDDPDQQPHPARARGAVHERRDRRPRPGARPGPRVRHRAAPPLRGRAARPPAARGRGPRGRPRPVRRRTPTSRRPSCSTTARSSSGFRGDDAATARLLARVRRGRACRSSASPGPRATSRSCSCRSPPPIANRWKRRRSAPTMTEMTDTADGTPAPVLPPRKRFTRLRPDRRRDRRDRRQGAARPDARPARLRRS